VAEALLMVPEARIETLEMAHAGARTIALVETAAGVMEGEQIARLGAVAGIAIGIVDLAVDLGLSGSRARFPGEDVHPSVLA
jgi:citrate lyase beta subunit